MANQTVDWILQRLYGSPHVDGYGSQVIEFNTNAVDYNLGRNTMYLLQFRHADGYWAVLDGYEGDNAAGVGDTVSESSVTDDTGVFAEAGTEKYVTTLQRRHVLSVKRPDGSSGAGEVRVIKMEPGKSLKDSDNSA